jgi:hypothetical protein
LRKHIQHDDAFEDVGVTTADGERNEDLVTGHWKREARVIEASAGDVACDVLKQKPALAEEEA